MIATMNKNMYFLGSQNLSSSQLFQIGDTENFLY